ncbi:MAG TPA: AMP-binding protein [Steroidobacteraceae bacterium]|nr:AMP-binding protein [Steroidobacteraceae bacterium]
MAHAKFIHKSMSNLYQSIQAGLHSQRARVVIDTRVRRLTGAQLDVLVGRYANALLELQVNIGDRVAAQVEKSLENIALYLACLRIGAVYLPLNSAYRSAEVEYLLSDAGPKVFVIAPERETELQPVTRKANVATTLTLGTNGDGNLPKLAAMQNEIAPIVPCDASDLAVICYTSGTTGRSKGAMITHGNLLSNATTLVHLWGFTQHDVLLHVLPLYHIHGLFVALHCALLSGAKILLQNAFNVHAVLDTLPNATVMMGVPTFYTRLLAEPALNREVAGNMRLFISGSAPMLTETFNAFEQRTGHRILERYGMTETEIISSNPLDGVRRAGTVGLPLPDVDVRIADPKNGVGVVEVKGPNIFSGYWNQPEKTRAEFRDGYFITGDIGTIESDGYLRLVGRAKDLIISGGLNVYPKEIEDAIDALPDVIESAVFAIPHPDFGEAVAAAVTVRRNSALTSDAIIATLRTQLAAFKMPKRVFVVDELPRNAMSKVQKNVLRERYKDNFTVS